MRSNQRKPTRLPDQFADLTLLAWLPDGRLAILSPAVGLRNFYVVVDVVETIKVAEKLANEYGLRLTEPIAPVFTENIEEDEQSKDTNDPPPFLERMAEEVFAYVEAHPDIRLVDVARGFESGKYSYQVIARAIRLLQIQGRIRHYRVGRHKYLTTKLVDPATVDDEVVGRIGRGLASLIDKFEAENGKIEKPKSSRRSDQEVDLRSPSERAKRLADLLNPKDQDDA